MAAEPFVGTHVAWLIFLAAALMTLSACEQPIEEEQEPPLRSLLYTESPGYKPAKAIELEKHLLSFYSENNRLPSATESAQMLAEQQALESDKKPDAKEVLEALMPEGELDLTAMDPMDVPVPSSKPKLNIPLRSPESVAETVFKALITQDPDLYDHALIDAEGLIALAKIRQSTADKRAASLRRKAAQTFKNFHPGNASEAPEGGLASRLALKDVSIGRAATLWGKDPGEGDEVVQYWNNSMTLKLIQGEEDQGPETIFTVNLGRMLKTPGGEWRMAAAPTVSAAFKAYLRSGFHMKAELMTPEHHPFPLSVGNFWRYRVKRASRNGEPLRGEDGEPMVEEIRIEVTDVKKFDGYRVVTLRRQRKHERTRSDKLRYLVTPKRLYHCSNFCRYKSRDMNFMLGYVRTQTPLLIFPVKRGQSWKAGGVISGKGRYTVRPQTELATVPAGEFNDALVISGRRGQNYVTRYFKQGIGIIQRVTRGPSDTRVEELIEYRILTTE